ncbi:hypothetical protein [Jejuia pallidilutea]|uniref:SIR2-like domain-containing protein n=1 Tax=Jejuia pallidilutea TaxID=504487 RepID=A0A090VKC7_9FLAO|nr:hypothetical protein [Jejuia pallidilutea]GAL65196.1 hypothetical protein JCM19301_3656 [Jejuia pallidilutea]GAL69245.1 hypothetical protein JCM19302_3974 [Jejuia pallidilutea]GAL89205.1 hypothetical protein JCM19538_2868 [Jejuia pallidilutea]
MATNITYLLGAGASFNAIPVVDGIPDALDHFANEFNPGKAYHNFAPIEFSDEKNQTIVKLFLYQHQNDVKTLREYHSKLRDFYKDIIWLKSEAKKHTSIDTFAKKLYLQEDLPNLKKLKTILSCFFIFLQTKKFDKRYDSLFASVLDDLNNLPGQIKLLSWNYDSQLEIAFSNFTNDSINEAKKKLKLHSKGDIMFDAYAPNEFCVYKINGTTNIQKRDFNIDNILSDFKSNNTSIIKTFLDLHGELQNFKSQPNMTFAWEDYNTEKGFFPNLRHSISETEILIVIGYSFPFFNRKVDKFILDSMSNLKKIYIQDPNNANDIIEKIKDMVPWQKSFFNLGKPDKPATSTKEIIKFIPKTFVEQFFIPVEF